MTMPVIALLVALEAMYIFISLKAIIREKLSVGRKIFLFFGIVAANLASGILYMTPFRFLMVAFLVFGLLKLVCRDRVYYYNLFLVKIVYGVKLAIELLIVLFIFGDNHEFTPSRMVAVGAALLVIPIGLYLPTQKIRNYVNELWHKDDTFLVRYVLCALFILLFIVFQLLMTQHF